MSHELTTRTFRIDSEGEYALGDSDVIAANGRHYTALLVGGKFQAVATSDHETSHTFKHNLYDLITGVIYRPIHPSMTLEDIEGATYVWDDGTYWRFAHASPGQHYDWTLNAEATLFSMFQPEINSRAITAASGLTVTERSKAAAEAKTLLLFIGEAQTELRKLADAATLGFFWRNPTDHTRQFIATAITNVWQSWQVIPALTDPQKAAQLRVRNGRISDAVAGLLIELRRKPKVTTAAEARAAAAAAEAAKKKKDADDGDTPAEE